MARNERVIYTCDRCGYKGSFEWMCNLPKGWANMRGMDLCPNCVEEYNTMLDKFFKPVCEKGD